MNFINFISKYKKTIIIYLILIALASIVFKTLKKIDTTEIQGTEEKLVIEEEQKLTTERDLLLPDANDEAQKEFEKYNILAFSKTSFTGNNLITDLTNNSSESIWYPSVTVFSKESDDYKEVIIDEEEIKPQQTITINETELNLGNYDILKYSYYVEIDGILTSIIVDLNSNAAYINTAPDGDLV